MRDCYMVLLQTLLLLYFHRAKLQILLLFKVIMFNCFGNILPGMPFKNIYTTQKKLRVKNTCAYKYKLMS